MALDKEGDGGRPEPQDAHVGQKAVDLGLITAAQLAAVLLQFSDAPAKASKPTSVSAALVSGGLLTQRQIEILDGNAAPTQVGKYRIVKELGRGGMGVVYEAEDVELHRRVALKMLLGSLHADPQETALEEERFIRESRLSASLPKHPHLVGVYEAGSDGGRRFIAMEFIEGRQFSDWRRGGSITIRQQVTVLRDVAMAVDHAHKHGVIHRDLKPQNVLVDSKNQPHVTDFGLAKRASRQATLSLTASGLVLGTPAYMAPEQAEGKKDVDRRADIWALGVFLYEILTGRLPFNGQTPLEILMKTVNEPVPLPSSFFPRGAHATLDRTIENICLKALAKDPKDRYPAAKAFADDLSHWLKGQKIAVAVPRRKKIPRSWIIGGAAAAVALAGAITLLVLPDSASDRTARAEEYVLEGRRHLQSRRYSDAIVSFGRAIAEDPDSRAAKAGKKEAEEKMVALGRSEKPTPSAPVAPPPPPDSSAPTKPREPGEPDTTVRSPADALAPLKAATLGIHILLLLPDGKSVLTAGFDRTVRLWDLETRKERRKLLEGVQAVSGAVSADGRWMAVGFFDASLRVWDTASLEVRVFQGHTAQVTGVAFTPDGKWLASSSTDGFARVWDTVSGAEKLATEGFPKGAMSLALSSDGKTLAVGSADRLIRILDMPTGKERQVLEDVHDGEVYALAVSPDGKQILTGGKERTSILIDLASGRRTTLIKIDPVAHQIRQVAFTPDGRWAVVSATEGTISFFDATTGAPVRTVTQLTNGFFSLVFTRKGDVMAAGTAQGTVQFWDVKSLGLPPRSESEADRKARERAAEQRRRELGELDTAIRSLVTAEGFGSARDFLQQAVKRHEEADWKDAVASRQNDLQKSVAGLLGTVKEEAAQAKRLGRASSVDVLRGRVDRWKWPGAMTELDEFLAKVSLPELPQPVVVADAAEPLKAHTNGVHVLALLPDGKTLLTGSFDQSVRLWDLETRKERRTLFKDFPVSCGASADGRWIGAGFTSATLRVWDTASFKLRTFPGHSAQVMGIVFSPDGKWACSTSTDGQARFWDVAAGTMTREVGGFPLGAMGIALAPDGKSVAVGSAERLVRILDLPSGNERKLFENVHQRDILALAFSPDGRQLVTGGRESVLLDVSSGRVRPLMKVSNPDLLFRQVAFTPDGRYAVVSCTDGNLSFFDPATATLVRRVPHKDARYFSMVFSKKGDVMIVGGADGTVHFYDVKSFGLPK